MGWHQPKERPVDLHRRRGPRRETCSCFVLSAFSSEPLRRNVQGKAARRWKKLSLPLLSRLETERVALPCAVFIPPVVMLEGFVCMHLLFDKMQWRSRKGQNFPFASSSCREHVKGVGEAGCQETTKCRRIHDEVAC